MDHLITIVNEIVLTIGFVASICTIILFVENSIEKFRRKRRKDNMPRNR